MFGLLLGNTTSTLLSDSVEVLNIIPTGMPRIYDAFLIFLGIIGAGFLFYFLVKFFIK